MHVEAHQYALFQVTRLLRYFHHVSQPVLGPKFPEGLLSNDASKLFESSATEHLQEVTPLEQHLYRSLIPQTHGPYQTIALESLLELSI